MSKLGYGNPRNADASCARRKNGGIIDRAGFGGKRKDQAVPLAGIAQALSSD
jgi:hypothetical protein